MQLNFQIINDIIQTLEIENQFNEINTHLGLLIEKRVKTKLDIMMERKSGEQIYDVKNILFNLFQIEFIIKLEFVYQLIAKNEIDEFSKSVINKELKVSFEKRINDYIDNEFKKIFQ